MDDLAVGDAFMMGGNFFAVLLIVPEPRGTMKHAIARTEYGIHATLGVHMATALSREFYDAFGSGATR